MILRALLLMLCMLLAVTAGAQSKPPPVKNAAEAEKKIEALRKEMVP